MFLSRSIELEIQLVKDSLTSSSIQDICILLLCIWGVTPSSDYLVSLTQLLSQLRDAYTSPSFYSTVFTMQKKEGIPIIHTLLIVIYLYLLDSRDIPLNDIHITSSVLSSIQLHIVYFYCAALEMQSEVLSSSFVLLF